MKHKNFLVPDWPAPANVHAATTLRTGGVSTAPFDSLNPAGHVGDNPKNVAENRSLIKQLLALPDDPVWLEQVHGNRIVYAQKSRQAQQADASYTDQAGVVCAVLTADCLPLLVCSSDGQQIAAIHAGWRGLLAGIISSTVAVFANHDLIIWLGPAIGPSCFEVGEEVLSAFQTKSPNYATAFKKQHGGKYLADIYQLARLELSGLGIDKIYGGGFCTVSDHNRFYSFRRDQQTGRMATLIWRD